MCNHGEYQLIEESMTEEKWEGDTLVQFTFDWVYCPECDDDFACSVN